MSGCGGCGSGYSGTGGGGGGGGGSGIPGTVTLTAGENLAPGDIVALMAPTGAVVKADTTLSLSPVLYWVIGVAVTAAVLGDSVTVMTVPGQLVAVNCAAPPPASANGSPLWLESMGSGLGSHTPPTLGSDAAFVRVGILVGADGATASPVVLLQLDFVAAAP